MRACNSSLRATNGISERCFSASSLRLRETCSLRLSRESRSRSPTPCGHPVCTCTRHSCTDGLYDGHVEMCRQVCAHTEHSIMRATRARVAAHRARQSVLRRDSRRNPVIFSPFTPCAAAFLRFPISRYRLLSTCVRRDPSRRCRSLSLEGCPRTSINRRH